eukprot:Em0307g2a
MTLVPARRLLPPTCSAVELHPDLLDECHPLGHPAIKLPVTTVVCPVECLNEPASFSKDMQLNMSFHFSMNRLQVLVLTSQGLFCRPCVLFGPTTGEAGSGASEAECSELFNPLVTCLKSCLDLDKDTSTSAQLLLNSMTKPEFIVATCVMNQVLAVTKPLSVHLQKTGIDVMKAMSLVDEIVACLDEMRSSDGSFAIVWKMAESLAEIVESDLKQPRIVAKQRNRVNVASSSDQEYFQRSVFYPFLDHVLSELRSRFSVHNTIVAHLWSLIPKFIVSYSFSDLQPALAIYANFLESEQAVQGEFEIWKKRWADKVDCPDTAIDALAVCDKPISFQISDVSCR